MRVASFFPFQATYYLNGHSFIEQELNRNKIGFRKNDNAFLAVDDVAALQEVADRLTGEVIVERLDYWTLLLGPKFSPRERGAMNLRRFYAVNKIEYCRNFIFKRNEICSNNLSDFRLKKGLHHLAAMREKFLAITDRFATFQAQCLNVHVEFPLLQRLALPVTVETAKFPGIKIHETRMIRLMEILLHGGTTIGELRPARGAQDPKALDTHYDAIRVAMQGVFHELGLAA